MNEFVFQGKQKEAFKNLSGLLKQEHFKAGGML